MQCVEPIFGLPRLGRTRKNQKVRSWARLINSDESAGAIEGTRTPTPLPVHGPEPCASANSATMASGLQMQRQPKAAGSGDCIPILQGGRRVSTSPRALGISLSEMRHLSKPFFRRSEGSRVGFHGRSRQIPRPAAENAGHRDDAPKCILDWTARSVARHCFDESSFALFTLPAIFGYSFYAPLPYASPMMTTNAILAREGSDRMADTLTSSERSRKVKDDPRWNAVLARDPARDGEFVFAVSTTGVYCRPSCPARRPSRERVQFFVRPEQAERAGYRACLRCRPKALSGNGQADSVRAICRFLEQHLDEPVTLARLGKEFRQSPFHLQRRFKAELGVTPREYADSCRLRLLKRNLQSGDNVTRAMYDAGYGSSSRLYERTASQLGMTPDKYRRGAIAATIRYAIADSPLGRMLVAATERGICAIQFGDSDSELLEGLKREFPFATRKMDETGLEAWTISLLERMDGKAPNHSLPLDIRATAFQRRVWRYLQSIPVGATRSYNQVARSIGQPTGARAVARACATNPVAVAIPCHRVVRGDGSLGGYRWGIERKKSLLEMERAAKGVDA
jgi:AraC family transcriptional regulator, regulatory protein of adaptative response / methylated-DNA-[protein]-cysteine methyltransferase